MPHVGPLGKIPVRIDELQLVIASLFFLFRSIIRKINNISQKLIKIYHTPSLNRDFSGVPLGRASHPPGKPGLWGWVSDLPVVWPRQGLLERRFTYLWQLETIPAKSWPCSGEVASRCVSSSQVKLTITLHYYKSEQQWLVPFALWILLFLESNVQNGVKWQNWSDWNRWAGPFLAFPTPSAYVACFAPEPAKGSPPRHWDPQVSSGSPSWYI